MKKIGRVKGGSLLKTNSNRTASYISIPSVR